MVEIEKVMMEFPQLPTDNLYKFMALSGIVLVVASLIPSLHAQKLTVDAIRLGGELKSLRKEVEWTQIDIQFLENDVDRMKQRVSNTAEDVSERYEKADDRESLERLSQETSQNMQNIVEEKREVEDKFEKIKEISRQQSISDIRLHAKVEESKYLQKAIFFEMAASIFGLVGGIVMGSSGFTLWYKRLQVLQDKILQAKAEGGDNKASKNGLDE